MALKKLEYMQLKDGESFIQWMARGAHRAVANTSLNGAMRHGGSLPAWVLSDGCPLDD